ncbi:MAG: single-stranded DNA-binding protein, partial [Bacteroidaceae bacterium]
MNSCAFVGNLGKDPEVRFTKTGKAVASFSIGVKREWEANGEKKEFTDWVNVVAWGKLGEYCGNNMDKGTRVIVHGRMQTRSYETADGTKKYVTEIIADFAA